MGLFANIFGRRKYRVDPVIELAEADPFLEGEGPKTVSPYVEQIQEFMEEHLTDSNDMEPVHNLGRWLLSHPEFLPQISMES